jgi:rhomboid protease GluP
VTPEPGALPAPPFEIARPRFYIRLNPPLVTRGLLAVNVLVFVAMIVYGWAAYSDLNGTENMRVLIAFGAKVNQLVAAGEVWRLFTAMFLHIGVLHLLFNLYALNALGPLVEGYFGHLRFGAIYLVGGLFGSLASYAFSPYPSAGASGAIFGLAGATTIYFLRYRENFGARGRAILQNMLLVIGINLLFGMTAQNIDNWGHMGGLVGGAILATGMLPKYRAPAMVLAGAHPLEDASQPVLQGAWLVLWSGVWLLGVQWATQRWLGLISG